MGVSSSRINVKKLASRLMNLYGSSDLSSLLLPYTERLQAVLGNRLRYPTFYERVKRTVSPSFLVLPEEIAAAMLPDGGSFSYRELSLFYDYAVLAALTTLAEQSPSDRLLCETVEYLKTLPTISTDELALSALTGEFPTPSLK